MNIKLKRLEKTAEIREAIISQTLNTNISIKEGIPNYSAVSPRPFKKKLESPIPTQNNASARKDSQDSIPKNPQQKRGHRNSAMAQHDSSGSISLPPIAAKPPVPE